MKTKVVSPEKSNITLRIDREVLREIRILAAEQDTSISALVTAKLSEAIKARKGRDVATMKSLARMRRGYNLGFTPPASRDELHER
jgi:hypothetical protein